MYISENSVVEFHYSVSENGTEIESSFGSEPLAYLHGKGGMLPGLEKAIEGKTQGDKFEVDLLADQAYGPRHEEAVQRIPLKHLQGAKKWKAGMTAIVNTDQGQRQVTLLKVGKFNADCDLNHPFAGKDLTFNVEIVSVREATTEEISHGHVHGAGGCGH